MNIYEYEYMNEYMIRILLIYDVGFMSICIKVSPKYIPV